MVLVVSADRVDRSAHRIPAVQECGGTFDDLQSCQLSDVDDFAVIAGLRGERPGADAVFHD